MNAVVAPIHSDVPERLAPDWRADRMSLDGAVAPPDKPVGQRGAEVARLVIEQCQPARSVVSLGHKGTVVPVPGRAAPGA